MTPGAHWASQLSQYLPWACTGLTGHIKGRGLGLWQLGKQGYVIAWFCASVVLSCEVHPCCFWLPGVWATVVSAVQLCSDLPDALWANSSSLAGLSSTVLFTKKPSLVTSLSHLMPHYVLGLYVLPPFIVFSQHQSLVFCNPVWP